MEDNKQPQFMVAIKCMTYNHKPYILNALNGFVMQKTTFPFIIILVDDASTDGEPEVIQKFISEQFDISDKAIAFTREDEHAFYTYARHLSNKQCYIIYLQLKKNLFREGDKKKKLYENWCSDAKYIAICEGDDYWIDENKLQKQVRILDADDTLMASVSNYCRVDKSGTVLNAKIGGVVKNDKEGRYTLRDFFGNPQHVYPTASVMYRNTHQDEISRMMKHTQNAYLGDWTLWIILHTFGDFYYFDEVMTAYRINPTSVTHTCDKVGRAKANVQICNSVADILPKEYADIANDLRHTNWVWISLMYAYKSEHRYLGFVYSVFMAAFKCPTLLITEIKEKFRKSYTKQSCSKS